MIQGSPIDQIVEFNFSICAVLLINWLNCLLHHTLASDQTREDV